MNTREKIIEAETRGSQWLADANELAERGEKARAELDRYNKLIGNT